MALMHSRAAMWTMMALFGSCPAASQDILELRRRKCNKGEIAEEIAPLQLSKAFLCLSRIMVSHVSIRNALVPPSSWSRVKAAFGPSSGCE